MSIRNERQPKGQEDKKMENIMKELKREQLEAVTGGTVYDNESREVILAEARRLSIDWKNRGVSLSYALEMLPRYFFIRGKTTKEDIAEIVKEVYCG